MAEKEDKKNNFVVTDKRKFTSEGDLRPDAPPETRPERTEAKKEEARPQSAPEPPLQVAHIPASPEDLAATPPPPTEAEQQEAQQAYARASREIDDRLAADLGGPRPQDFQVTFEKFVTTLYMSAMFQLGFVHEEGRQPRIDLLGARQTIDTLELIATKTKGNLTAAESAFLEERLYELRVGYLDMLHAVAQAAQQSPPPPPGDKK